MPILLIVGETSLAYPVLGSFSVRNSGRTNAANTPAPAKIPGE